MVEQEHQFGWMEEHQVSPEKTESFTPVPAHVALHRRSSCSPPSHVRTQRLLFDML